MSDGGLVQMFQLRELANRDYLRSRIAPAESIESLCKFPRYFEIETVNACNARCPMCTIDDWERRDGLMDFYVFEKIAEEICANADKVERVALYRDGEPLLDKMLSYKVRTLKRGGVKRVGISTNAALLNVDRSQRLIESGLDEIILSVDSLVPSVYEAIRKGLKFDEVLENCLKFIEIRDARKSTCQVWVRMIRQESNYAEWPEFERYWRSMLQPTDRVDYRNIHGWGGQLKGFKPIAKASTEKACVALWSLMVIFANGDVPFCNVDFLNKYPLGNVRTSSIADLWQSQEQNRRREKHLHNKRENICVGCDVWAEEANSGAEKAA